MNNIIEIYYNDFGEIEFSISGKIAIMSKEEFKDLCSLLTEMFGEIIYMRKHFGNGCDD